MKVILVLTHLALVLGLTTALDPTATLSEANNLPLAQLNPTQDTSKPINAKLPALPVQNASDPTMDKHKKALEKLAAKAALKSTYDKFLAMESSPDDKKHMDQMMEKMAGITPGSEDSMLDKEDPAETSKPRKLDDQKEALPESYNNSLYNNNSSSNLPTNQPSMGHLDDRLPIGPPVTPRMNPRMRPQMNMGQQGYYPPNPNYPRLNLTNNATSAYPYNRQLGMGSFSAPDLSSSDPIMSEVGNETISSPESGMGGMGGMGDMKDNFQDMNDSSGGGDMPANFGSSLGGGLDSGMHESETQALISRMDQNNHQSMADMDKKMAMADLEGGAIPGGVGPGHSHHKKQSIASLLKDYPPELVHEFMPELKRRVMQKVHGMEHRKKRNRQLKHIQARIKKEQKREKKRELRMKRNKRHHHHHHHHNRPHHHHRPHHRHHSRNHRKMRLNFRPMRTRKVKKRSHTSSLKILKNYVHKHTNYRHWARNLEEMPDVVTLEHKQKLPERMLTNSNPTDQNHSDAQRSISSDALNMDSPQTSTRSDNQTPQQTSSINKSLLVASQEANTQNTSPKLDTNSVILSVANSEHHSSPQVLKSTQTNELERQSQIIDDSDFVTDLTNMVSENKSGQDNDMSHILDEINISQHNTAENQTNPQLGMTESQVLETEHHSSPLVDLENQGLTSAEHVSGSPHILSQVSDTGLTGNKSTDSGLLDTESVSQTQKSLLNSEEATQSISDLNDVLHDEDHDIDAPDDDRSENIDSADRIKESLNDLGDLSQPGDINTQEASTVQSHSNKTQQVENLMGNMGGNTLTESDSNNIPDFDSQMMEDNEILSHQQSFPNQSAVQEASQNSLFIENADERSIPIGNKYQNIETDEASRNSLIHTIEEQISSTSHVPLTDQLEERTEITDENGDPLDKSQKENLLQELEQELSPNSQNKPTGKHPKIKAKINIKQITHDQKVNMFHYMPPQIIFLNPYGGVQGQQMPMNGMQQMPMNGMQQMPMNGVQQMVMNPNQMQNSQMAMNPVQMPMQNTQMAMNPNQQAPLMQNPNYSPQNNANLQNPQMQHPGPIVNINNNNHSHGSTHSSYEVGQDGQLHQITLPDNEPQNQNLDPTGQNLIAGNSVQNHHPGPNWGQVVFAPNVGHPPLNTNLSNIANSGTNTLQNTGNLPNLTPNPLLNDNISKVAQKEIITPEMNNGSTLNQIRTNNGFGDNLPSKNAQLPIQQPNLDLHPEQNTGLNEFTVDVDPNLVNNPTGQVVDDQDLNEVDSQNVFDGTPNMITNDNKSQIDRKVPFETDNEMKIPEIKPNLQYQKTTREFHHYLSPGQVPDYKDLMTNPKYGHKEMLNTIWELTKGRPAKNIIEKNKDNGVTEEWVDDREILKNKSINTANSESDNQNLLENIQNNEQNGKSLDLNLSLTNSSLENMPDGFSKDFNTDDADIHFTIDKSALAGFNMSGNQTSLNPKDCIKNKLNKGHRSRQLTQARTLRGQRLERESSRNMHQNREDRTWNRALHSFDSSEERIIDDELEKYNPESSRQLGFAPSKFALDFNSMNTNPRKSSKALLSGVGDENKDLERFVSGHEKGMKFEEDDDQQAALDFEKQMREGGMGLGRRLV